MGDLKSKEPCGAVIHLFGSRWTVNRVGPAPQSDILKMSDKVFVGLKQVARVQGL